MTTAQVQKVWVRDGEYMPEEKADPAKVMEKYIDEGTYSGLRLWQGGIVNFDSHLTRLGMLFMPLGMC